MKDIRPALYALLVNDPTVNSLCGGRIYPVRMKQGVRDPSIVYHRITGLTDYQMNGSSGLLQNLMQFDSVATTADSATLLANAVHDVLSGHRGEVFYGTASPQNSVFVHGIFQTNDRDIFDDLTEMFSVQRDFEVWFWEN
jgi:Protein of unknown function (DUF3168)